MFDGVRNTAVNEQYTEFVPETIKVKTDKILVFNIVKTADWDQRILVSNSSKPYFLLAHLTSLVQLAPKIRWINRNWD